MLKGLANLGNIVRQAQQMTGRMQEVQDRLRAERVTGSAGGGMVQVEANGLGEILKLTIDPALIQRQEQDMIEDLVPAAVNQALAKAKQSHAAAIQSLTQGLELPMLDDIIAKATGSQTSDE